MGVTSTAQGEAFDAIAAELNETARNPQGGDDMIKAWGQYALQAWQTGDSELHELLSGEVPTDPGFAHYTALRMRAMVQAGMLRTHGNFPNNCGGLDFTSPQGWRSAVRAIIGDEVLREEAETDFRFREIGTNAVERYDLALLAAGLHFERPISVVDLGSSAMFGGVHMYKHRERSYRLPKPMWACTPHEDNTVRGNRSVTARARTIINSVPPPSAYVGADLFPPTDVGNQLFRLACYRPSELASPIFRRRQESYRRARNALRLPFYVGDVTEIDAQQFIEDYGLGPGADCVVISAVAYQMQSQDQATTYRIADELLGPNGITLLIDAFQLHPSDMTSPHFFRRFNLPWSMRAAIRRKGESEFHLLATAEDGRCRRVQLGGYALGAMGFSSNIEQQYQHTSA